jgi:ribosomal-protein-alanine N-acetyltransferase
VTAVQPSDTDPWIRQAARADLLDVFRLEKEVFGQPWPYSAFERQLGTPGFLVADDTGAGAVTGYIVADDIPGHGRPLGHVKNLAVHPERRGEGVGSSLLARGLSVLAGQGARSVKLEVRESNDAARSLYQRFDFEYLRTLPRYYADGEDAYVMVASLDDWDGDRDGF